MRPWNIASWSPVGAELISSHGRHWLSGWIWSRPSLLDNGILEHSSSSALLLSIKWKWESSSVNWKCSTSSHDQVPPAWDWSDGQNHKWQSALVLHAACFDHLGPENHKDRAAAAHGAFSVSCLRFVEWNFQSFPHRRAEGTYCWLTTCQIPRCFLTWKKGTGIKKWPRDAGKHLGNTHGKELLIWVFKKGSLSGCSRVTLKSHGRWKLYLGGNREPLQGLEARSMGMRFEDG